MNILHSIDQSLLDYTKHIARWVYRIFGITNFGIARLCIVLGILFQTGAMFYFIRTPEFARDTMLFQGIVIFFFTGVYFSVGELEKKIKPGALNNNRIILRYFRIIWIILGFIFFFIALVIWGIAPMDYTTLFVSFFASSFIVGFLFSLYFVSIEPEPPSKSKLKKLMGRIRKFFLTSTIPQPA